MLKKLLCRSAKYSVLLIVLLLNLSELCFGQTASMVTGGPLTTLPGGNPNLLINGGFTIDQRRALNYSTFTNISNNSYALDRWKFYGTSSNSTVGVKFINLTQGTPAGQTSTQHLAMKGDTKGMIVQVMEQKRILELLSAQASLSFYSKSSATSEIYAGVLCWTGTADYSPNSPISSWTGNVPSLAQNWQWASYQNYPTGTSWANYSLGNISIPSSCTNLVVAIWLPATMSGENTEWGLAGIKFEAGPQVTAWAPRFYSEELKLAQYYFSCPPVAGSPIAPIAYGTGATQWFPNWQFPGGPMRITPSVTVSSPVTGNGNSLYQIDGGTDVAISSVPYLTNLGVGQIDASNALGATTRYSARICAEADFY